MNRSDEEVGRILRNARPERDAAAVRARGLARVLSNVVANRSTPTRAGRFVLEDEIGQQGTSVLYRAYDPDLQRTLLVQLVSADDTARDLLIRQAKLLAALEHPGVLAVYDVGRVGDALYIAMEHVAGVTMETWLRARPDAPWKEVVALFAQAGRGLVAMLDAGVRVRGFDLGDVLVGDDGRVRVRGFGRPAAPTEDPDDDPVLAYLYALDDVLRRKETAAARPLPRGLRQLVRPRLRDPKGTDIDLGALIHALEALLDPAAEDRDRALLLERVRRFWIDGVLAESLGPVEPVPLWIRARPETLASGANEPAMELPEHASTEDLPEILDDTTDRLLLLGGPGSGKTTTLLRLAYHLIEVARADTTQPVPVVLNLSSWSAHRVPIGRWIEDEILTKYSLPRRSTRRWIDRGQLVLLLDGLDEVIATRRPACVDAINEFAETAKVQIVVGTREDEYLACRSKLCLPMAVSLEPLDDVAVEGMIEELGERAHGLREAMRRNPELLEHARCPLVLGMLAVVGAETVEDPHHFRRALYERYIGSAFRRRGSHSRYSRKRIVDGLHWLAAAMRRNGLSELWLERLQREFFESRWQRLTALGLGLVLLLAITIAVNTGVLLTTFPFAHALHSGVSVGVLTVPLCFAFVGSSRVVPVDALRWSWAQVERRAPSTFGWGLLAAAGYGLVFSTTLGILMATPALVVLAALRGFESREEPGGVRPNRGILQSSFNAATFGFGVALVTGALFAVLVVPGLEVLYTREALLALNVVPGWPLFLGAGAAFGGVAAMTYGGIAVALHVAVRTVMALSTPLPLRLRPFLDCAVERALLRRVGGGYIFVHRALMEHLADTPSQTSDPAGP